MKAAPFLAGIAIGFALRAWDVNHFIGVISAAMFGVVLTVIVFGTDLAVRVVRSKTRTLDDMRADLPPWPDPPSEAL